MKIKIGLLLSILVYAISFSSCKKDEDKVIPDITGSTYELYKMTYSFLGQSQSMDVSDTDYEYYIWVFEEGGVLKNKYDLECGTWSQNGENVTVVYYGDTRECKVSGNNMTIEYEEEEITIKEYLRKI